VVNVQKLMQCLLLAAPAGSAYLAEEIG